MKAPRPFCMCGTEAAYQVCDAAGKRFARRRPRVGQLLVVVHALVGGD